jgi:hypothetical protein
MAPIWSSASLRPNARPCPSCDPMPPVCSSQPMPEAPTATATGCGNGSFPSWPPGRHWTSRCVPPAPGHVQVEQDRAPPVLGDLSQPARTSPRRPRGDRRADRSPSAPAPGSGFTLSSIRATTRRAPESQTRSLHPSRSPSTSSMGTGTTPCGHPPSELQPSSSSEGPDGTKLERGLLRGWCGEEDNRLLALGPVTTPKARSENSHLSAVLLLA